MHNSRLNSRQIKVSILPSHVHNSVRKSQNKSHTTLQAKRAPFTFRVGKSSLKMPKMVNLSSFWKPEAFGQIVVLLDRQTLIRQNWWEMPKFKNQMRHFWWFSNNVCVQYLVGTIIWNERKKYWREFLARKIQMKIESPYFIKCIFEINIYQWLI